MKNSTNPKRTRWVRRRSLVTHFGLWSTRQVIFRGVVALLLVGLIGCWDLNELRLDERHFEALLDGEYFSVGDSSGPIGVYKREGNWYIPQHRVDPTERAIDQKRFEASQFALIPIDKFAPPRSRFELIRPPSFRYYSSKLRKDPNDKIAILVGQTVSDSGAKQQYLTPVLVNGLSISRCTGYGVFPRGPKQPSYEDYTRFVDTLYDKVTDTKEKTQRVIEIAISNIDQALDDGRIRCDQRAYKVTDLSADQVRATVARIVPAKVARLRAREEQREESRREYLAHLKAQGVQVLIQNPNGYYFVNNAGIAKCEATGVRGGVPSYQLRVVKGHPRSVRGLIGRVRFYADTQQFEFQNLAATRNGSCAEYTDPHWSGVFELSEFSSPGVWNESRQFTPSRIYNGDACLAYDVTVGSCRRTSCALRKKDQRGVNYASIVRDYETALDIYSQNGGR